MKIKSFLATIIANILQIEYFTTYYNTLKQNEALIYGDKLRMDWMSNHMGSRGKYPNYLRLDFLEDKITIDYNIEQIQFIVRHGNRYPVLRSTSAINNTLLKLKESKNKDLVSWIEDYENDYLLRRAGQLSRIGQDEEYTIGQRLATRYPDFIPSLIDEYVIQQFHASTSWSERTSQSGQALCIGAFEGLGKLGPAKLMSVPLFSLPKNNDSLIAFHKACPKWQKYAPERTTSLIQPLYDLYLEPIARRLSKDLGITITSQDTKDIHDACTTEVSFHETTDTFCKLLTRDDVEEMEYIDDLSHYYKYSYGLPELNNDMACDLGKDILNNIELAMNSPKTAVKLDIKIGHSETLLPLRTLLGLYKDEAPLSANSTKEEIENRKFRLSKFGFYGNHMTFQLLSSKKDQKLYVRVLDNHKPILLPGCKDIICPVKEFRNYMQSRTQCDFIELCKLE